MKTDELKAHENNANKGTEFGEKLIKRSLKEYGIGKSVVVDKDNNIIAGNHVTKKLNEEEAREVHVVESEGDTPIAVMRSDMDATSQKGKEAALIDNRSGELNLAWDKTMLQEHYGEDILDKYMLHSAKKPKPKPSSTGVGEDGFYTDNFNTIKVIVVKYSKEDFIELSKKLEYAKNKHGLETNTELFTKMIEQAYEKIKIN